MTNDIIWKQHFDQEVAVNLDPKSTRNSIHETYVDEDFRKKIDKDNMFTKVLCRRTLDCTDKRNLNGDINNTQPSHSLVVTLLSDYWLNDRGPNKINILPKLGCRWGREVHNLLE